MDKPSPSDPSSFQWSFLRPQYWGIWLITFFLFILAILPWSVQRKISTVLVGPAWKYLKSRRKTTIRNIETCFPDKSPAEVEQAGKEIFLNALLGLCEALNAWYSPKWFKDRVDITGLEHIENIKGRGILFLSFHSTLLDAGGYICSLFFELDVVYRPNNNPLLNMLICRSRSRVYKNQISKNDMRSLIRHLKNGRAVWYSPDQDFGLKQGVMAPFFGIHAATLTAHRRIIQISNAAAIPLFFYRTGDLKNPRYQICIEPELENFPSSDEVFDATRVNHIIETQIRIAPTQYMWFHRRFKTRPAGFEKIYD
ncbi:lipid A biosynthesis lauroyl acyltransferase [Acinetobacter rudis]|uniref:Lipid A biosynthesis acyltransferase n=1 Tax=Acinetobacter rudis CIP 110305 TaxID=421052 RepID=S3NMR1_9GAMM|nr:lipid A biosynthesis lauroyl acyltransferase [Acinetobacter rudis]EPF75579.1 lipid A biosynthesis lauroyl acyltransferase [Acinetobacter rudis CIP 110305]